MEDQELKTIQAETQGMVASSPWPLQQVEKISATIKGQIQNLVGQEVFVPNEQQMRFLRIIFNPKTGSELNDWLDQSNTSEKELKVWWDNPGFVAWISAEAERRMMLFKLEWLAIGVKKMHHNVETWKVMKDLFFPFGVEHTPSEKGSKRQKLEQEVKNLMEKKKEIGKTSS